MRVRIGTLLGPDVATRVFDVVLNLQAANVRGKVLLAADALNVYNQTVFVQQLDDDIWLDRLIEGMRYSSDDRVVTVRKCVIIKQKPVFMICFSCICERIVHRHIMSDPLETTDDIDDLRIPKIGHVFLKSNTQHENLTYPTQPRMYLAGNVKAHGVVHGASRQNHLRIVPKLLRHLAIGVDADAVAAGKAWLKLEKIPFCCGRLQRVVD